MGAAGPQGEHQPQIGGACGAVLASHQKAPIAEAIHKAEARSWQEGAPGRLFGLLAIGREPD